ncbi:MAG TPA: (Fe-S)-binding protein [Thermodesulfobacteriota bacterium]|nr:(Fe-S)-binding protein [Thermodesulfobacteriota bacterium]
MKRQKIRLSDISKNPEEQLLQMSPEDFMPLPHPCEQPRKGQPIYSKTGKKEDLLLDGISALGIPKPKNREEEKRWIDQFLSGLGKLLSRTDNWTFWQPLVHTLESCVRCQVCSDACHTYLSSGRQEIYRPTYRAEILRRIVKKYIKKEGYFFTKLTGGDIELNWATIARLGELAYRCTLCRRCAQWCPLGCDNGLIGREIRKLFSQEMGIAPKELHQFGSVQHLKTGGSTGMTPEAFRNIIEFMEEEIEEKTGKSIKVPVDREGADILLIHNSGEYLAWLENPEAFAILFDAAGLSWTLSSELYGYEGTNYGTWYDDVQFARIALRQIEAARRLKVKKIVIGECGHSHKGLTVIADRILTGEMNFPRESYLPILEDLVCSRRLNLDPRKNSFLVTLHDPCNVVRLMGIIKPQRRILKEICPSFREMEPHGPENYCCGGGSGFAIMSENFRSWRVNISGRMKLKQTLDTFQDSLSPEIKKYVCAPCSNCKGQYRDLLEEYDLKKKCNILFGGLAELVVNAMVDIEKPFMEWD